MRTLVSFVVPVILTIAAHTACAGGDQALGLPPLPPAAESRNAALVTLGNRLFFDSQLSDDKSISCSSCHDPAKTFADGRAVSTGVRGRKTTRNAPSLLNVAFNQTLFWDGRRSSLEEQALDPVLNPVEHGLGSIRELLDRLRADSAYVALFQAAFDTGSEAISEVRIAKALAAFERTLLSADSRFDRYYYRKDQSALTASEERGFRVFSGIAGCTECHRLGDRGALFSDEKFHSVSGAIAKIAPRLPKLTSRLVGARKGGMRLDREILDDRDLSELGRFVITMNPADIGSFKTPGLRNVALTAPYMHDGSVATLKAAVDAELYRRGDEAGRPIVITPAERADLVDFLGALTGADQRLLRRIEN